MFGHHFDQRNSGAVSWVWQATHALASVGRAP